MTPDLLWRRRRIDISSVVFVKSMMLMSVFVCPYSFLNIAVIPVYFYYFNFCFKFYYPIVDIILSHLYFYFSVPLKPVHNVVTKTKRTHSVIILA